MEKVEGDVINWWGKCSGSGVDHRRWSEVVGDDLEVVDYYGKGRLKGLMNWWRNTA